MNFFANPILMYEDNVGRYGYIKSSYLSETPFSLLVFYVAVAIVLFFTI